MMSTLTLSKRSRAMDMARRALSAVWMRCSVRSVSSCRLCTPMLRRFTPSAQMSLTISGVRLSGFASMEHSTSGVRCMLSESVYRILLRRFVPT